MPVARHHQTSLSAGEFDPLLWSREDVAFFYNSARLIENVVPLPQGGGKRREGWRFRALQRGTILPISLSGATITAPNGGTAANLVDGTDDTLFVADGGVPITGVSNANPAVVTSAGHGFATGMTVRVSGVVGLENSFTILAPVSGATNANPCVITAVASSLVTGQRVMFSGVGGMTELNGNVYTVATVSADTFSIGVDSSGFGTYTSGGDIDLLIGSGINGHVGAITVLDADTFSLNGFNSTALTPYISGGLAGPGIGTATAFEVFRVDLATAQKVSMIDVNRLRITFLASLGLSAAVTIQRSPDGSAWTSAGTLAVGAVGYNRRFAAPPNQDMGTARFWRMIVDNPSAADLGTTNVETTGIVFRAETGYSDGGALGEFSLHRLTAAIDAEYVLVLVAGCCDVFRGTDGAWMASVLIPHGEMEVASVKTSPSLDTLILYHMDQPPWLIQRLGTDGDWRAAAVPFDSVVDFPFEDAAVSGGENEIQFLRFDDMAAGNKVLVEYNGRASAEVVWATDHFANAAGLRAAIEGLEDFASVEGRVNEGTGVNARLEVEFTEGDGKRPWPILVVRILTGAGTVEVSRKQFGRKDTAPLWSVTRGYPRCGAFYQGRHWMGGFRSRPDLVVASRAGELFDFKEDADPVPSSPLVVAPNIDDQVTVQSIYPGRHLQIFTSSAEIFVPNEPISIDNIALKVTTRHGSGAVTPVDVQGGTIFADRQGTALREYLFTDSEQSYSAEPVSLMAGHLVSSPRSMALRRARGVAEPTTLLIANTGVGRSGSAVPAALVVIDRVQQVTGFCRIRTPGRPLEFAATQGGDGFAMVRRSLAGASWNYLEQFDAGFMSDCSVRVEGSGSIIDLSAWPWMEGRAMQVHGDGLPLGEYTVTAGQIDLEEKSFEAEAEVGLKMVPRIILHAYKGKGEASPTMQNMRIYRVLLQLDRTGGVAITAHLGGAPRQVALKNFDSGVMDPTLEETLFTGAKRIGGMGSWQREPRIEITQIEPMPFLMRSLTYDIRF